MKTWFLTAFCAAAAVSTLTGCPGGPVDLCKERGTRCDDPLSCDPSDGVCKCGGRGGVVQQEGFECDPSTNTLKPLRCTSNVQCSRGTSCDVFDGKCKCGGTGGQECAAGLVCDAAIRECVRETDCSRVSCPLNQLCDNADGRCKCSGALCGTGRFCSVGGACIDSLCSGVTCTGDNVCDPADGYCKCNGGLCQGGETCGCSDGGTCTAEAKACVTSSACSGKTCLSGTTCDPADGQCKCGGPGNPPGPVCGAEQICSLGPPPQCQGGQQCLASDGGTKACGGGTSCDPEDGACKCGGRGGQECRAQDGGDPGEICVATATRVTCRRPCDPTQVVTGCPAGTACFYDSTTTTPNGFCAAPSGTPTPDGGVRFRVEGQGCSVATACYATEASPPAGLHCFGLSAGSTGICRSYCDTRAGPSGCSQALGPQSCVQIPTAPVNFGYCNPQQ